MIHLKKMYYKTLFKIVALFFLFVFVTLSFKPHVVFADYCSGTTKLDYYVCNCASYDKYNNCASCKRDYFRNGTFSCDLDTCSTGTGICTSNDVDNGLTCELLYSGTVNAQCAPSFSCSPGTCWESGGPTPTPTPGGGPTPTPTPTPTSCGRCSTTLACRYASWTNPPGVTCSTVTNPVTYTSDDSCDLCPSGQICSGGVCVSTATPTPTPTPTPGPTSTPTPTPTSAPGTIRARAMQVSTSNTSCTAVRASSTGVSGTVHQFTPSSASQPAPKTQSGSSHVVFTSLIPGSYTIGSQAPAGYQIARYCWSRSTAPMSDETKTATLYPGDTLTWDLGYTSCRPDMFPRGAG